MARKKLSADLIQEVKLKHQYFINDGELFGAFYNMIIDYEKIILGTYVSNGIEKNDTSREGLIVAVVSVSVFIVVVATLMIVRYLRSNRHRRSSRYQDTLATSTSGTGISGALWRRSQDNLDGHIDIRGQKISGPKIQAAATPAAKWTGMGRA